MVLLKIEDLAIGYKEPLVKGIDIEVKSPALVQIMGPNGAGKTTFLKTLIGILKPLKGRILIDGVDVTGNPEKTGRLISYVPQIATYIVGEVFPITVWEFLEFELKPYRARAKLSNRDVDKLIEETLRTVGIPENLWRRGIDKLSGGQRQRLLIARALLKDSSVYAMDEPLSAIDVEGRAIIAEIIGRLKERDRIVISTCHDPYMLIEYTDYVMLMVKGFYLFGEPEEVLKSSMIAETYGGCLIGFEKHIHIYDYHL